MKRRMRLMAFLVAAAGALAGADWTKVSTENFVLYTPAKPKKAVAKALQLEAYADFFRRQGAPAWTAGEPVLMVGFRSIFEFRKYRSAPGTDAYYVDTGWRRMIVFSSMEEEDGGMVARGLVHLLIDRAGLRLPPWLRAGMADFYTTALLRGDRIILGRRLEYWYRRIRISNWIPAHKLVDPAQHRIDFGDWARTRMVRVETWLLAHMLILSPRYRAGFLDFLARLHEGDSVEDAFQKVYGRPLNEVNADLRDYYERPLRWVAVTLPPRRVGVKPMVEPAGPACVDAILAILADKAGRRAEFEERLARLRRFADACPDASEVLGFLALRRGDFEAAERRLARAVEAGSRNPRVYLRYADLLERRGASPAERIKSLKRLTEVAPAHQEGRLRLGLALTSAGRYREALAHLERVRTVDPGLAGWYFSALALGHCARGSADEAAKAARQAIARAGSEAERRVAQRILNHIAGGDSDACCFEQVAEFGRTLVKPPPIASGAEAEMRGTLEQMECLGFAGRLRIQCGGRPVWLALYRREQAAVSGAVGGGQLPACGKRVQVRVRLVYEPRVDAELLATGVVRRIEILGGK